MGLFKHRRQSNWVKTEHSIHHIEDMTVRLGDVGIGREETPSRRKVAIRNRWTTHERLKAGKEEKRVVSVVIPVYNARPPSPAAWTAFWLRRTTIGRYWLSTMAARTTAWTSCAATRSATRGCALWISPNGGVAAARNRGLGEATGDWVQFVDSDDTLLPDAMERMVRAMETNQSDLAIAPYVEIMGGKLPYARA